MATGVTRQYSASFNDRHELHPVQSDEALPSGRGSPRLELPDRLSDESILHGAGAQFVELTPSGEINRKPHITTESVLFGDNLAGLRALLPSFAGKIKLFYIDPPYATGLSFHSRANSHAYEDTLSPFAYLEFMRRRLVVMRELLADDGSVYIHIGHQMLAHLKVLADEVFGPENFRNLILRRKCSSKNYTSKSLPNIHDYILFYTKGKNYVWNPPGAPASPEWIAKEYTKVDAKGRYKLVPIHAPGIRSGETGKPWKGMQPPAGKHWQLTPDKLDALDAAGEIHWSKSGNPRRKVYLSPDKQQNLTDYWPDFRDAHHQSIKVTGYPTEKNFEMLRTIIKASSNSDDIVCDCFMGSGTTLEAAHIEGRRWLGLDCSPEAVKSTVKRFTGGREAMGTFVDSAKGLQGTLPLDAPTTFRLLVEERYATENSRRLQSLFRP